MSYYYITNTILLSLVLILSEASIFKGKFSKSRSSVPKWTSDTISYVKPHYSEDEDGYLQPGVVHGGGRGEISNLNNKDNTYKDDEASAAAAAAEVNANGEIYQNIENGDTTTAGAASGLESDWESEGSLFDSDSSNHESYENVGRGNEKYNNDENNDDDGHVYETYEWESQDNQPRSNEKDHQPHIKDGGTLKKKVSKTLSLHKGKKRDEPRDEEKVKAGSLPSRVKLTNTMDEKAKSGKGFWRKLTSAVKMVSRKKDSSLGKKKEKEKKKSDNKKERTYDEMKSKTIEKATVHKNTKIEGKPPNTAISLRRKPNNDTNQGTMTMKKGKEQHAAIIPQLDDTPSSRPTQPPLPAIPLIEPHHTVSKEKGEDTPAFTQARFDSLRAMFEGKPLIRQ